MDLISKKSCCGPSAKAMGSQTDTSPSDYLALAEEVALATSNVRAEIRERLCEIPGGIYEIGARRSRFPQDLDSPRRKIKISNFLMSPFAVTNADFAFFVEDTGYRTVAEQEGWSYVFHALLEDAASWPMHPPGLSWWRKVDGASWSAPEGRGSSTEGRENHPAIHIAWYDALAYANWAGVRLPREGEWERAARGGLVRKRFPWGNQMQPGGDHKMNTFQGQFPDHNTADDGWVTTAPVDAFEANGYGMYNMTGNVWEWVHDFHGPRPEPQLMPEIDPKGPSSGHARIQRGGSYLCHESYCDRYHVHSRSWNDPDSSTGHCGFRIAADL